MAALPPLDFELDGPLDPRDAANLERVLEMRPTPLARLVGCTRGQASAMQLYLLATLVIAYRRGTRVDATDLRHRAAQLYRRLSPRMRADIKNLK